LIGEHIDYHNLPVLPMAIPRYITLDWTPSDNDVIHVESAGYGVRKLRLSDPIEPDPPGDWANYLKAAVKAVQTQWSVNKGFQGSVTSDLPSAAGLSSSSALITALTLALLYANDIQPTLEDLMSILPEGEHFVGTRGGGMDHAAVLASRQGFASLLQFAPFGVEHVQVPEDWRFLAAHSLVRAEKSGAAKARYNACRTAGLSAFAKLDDLASLTADERDAYQHVVSEAQRVRQAVDALRCKHRSEFGSILFASHLSLRDQLQVSCPALDRIVEISKASGADGARLTGAGFGGCAIILCTDDTKPNIISALEREFYARHAEYKRDEHLLEVTPASGALYAN
jgi:galactokinase